METKAFITAFKDGEIVGFTVGKETETKGRRYLVLFDEGKFEIFDTETEETIFKGSDEEAMLNLVVDGGKTIKDYVEELEDGFEVKFL